MATPVWLMATTFEPRGSSFYTLRLAEGLKGLGFDPMIVCESAALAPDRLKRSITFVEAPGLTHPIKSWLALRSLLRRHGATPPALLHAQRRSLGPLTCELARRLCRPYLVTAHESVANDEPWTLLPAGLVGIIAISPSVGRNLVERSGIPTEQVWVIPSGVELPEQIKLPAPRKAHEIPIIGCACPLEAQKGVTYFLMAAELILSSGQDAEFVVAGSGPEEETVRRVAQRLDIANRVTFVTHARDYRPIVESFDIFVLPSLEQGLGTIMLEAMALGKPVVATQVGGVADFLTDGAHALLAPRGNHIILAEKIQLLLDNPERARRLATAGEQLVRSSFSVEKMAKETAAIYQRAIASTPLAAS